MKVSMIAERADIATGTFYHFFDSKEAYVKSIVGSAGPEDAGRIAANAAKRPEKLTIDQAIRWFRDSFRTENNILMELTLDDWGWLKSHRTKDGLFSAAHDEQEAKRYLACVDGLRSDLDIRIIINFFKNNLQYGAEPGYIHCRNI